MEKGYAVNVEKNAAIIDSIAIIKKNPSRLKNGNLFLNTAFYNL
jgi:hypothetical protein